VAGGIYGPADGRGAAAQFRSPGSVAVTAGGTIVVADTVSNTIRRVDVDGNVTTSAGGIYGQGDLAAGRPSFRAARGRRRGLRRRHRQRPHLPDRPLRADRPGGRTTPARIAGRSRGRPALATDTIRRIGPDGTTTVVAAEPGWQPVGLAILADGRLIAAETHWSPAQSTGRLRTCGPS
jgi:hypothetical protein